MPNSSCKNKTFSFNKYDVGMQLKDPNFYYDIKKKNFYLDLEEDEHSQQYDILSLSSIQTSTSFSPSNNNRLKRLCMLQGLFFLFFFLSIFSGIILHPHVKLYSIESSLDINYEQVFKTSLKETFDIPKLSLGMFLTIDLLRHLPQSYITFPITTTTSKTTNGLMTLPTTKFFAKNTEVAEYLHHHHHEASQLLTTTLLEPWIIPSSCKTHLSLTLLTQLFLESLYSNKLSLNRYDDGNNITTEEMDLINTYIPLIIEFEQPILSFLKLLKINNHNNEEEDRFYHRHQKNFTTKYENINHIGCLEMQLALRWSGCLAPKSTNFLIQQLKSYILLLSLRTDDIKTYSKYTSSSLPPHLHLTPKLLSTAVKILAEVHPMFSIKDNYNTSSYYTHLFKNNDDDDDDIFVPTTFHDYYYGTTPPLQLFLKVTSEQPVTTAASSLLNNTISNVSTLVLKNNNNNVFLHSIQVLPASLQTSILNSLKSYYDPSLWTTYSLQSRFGTRKRYHTFMVSGKRDDLKNNFMLHQLKQLIKKTYGCLSPSYPFCQLLNPYKFQSNIFYTILILVVWSHSFVSPHPLTIVHCPRLFFIYVITYIYEKYILVLVLLMVRSKSLLPITYILKAVYMLPSYNTTTDTLTSSHPTQNYHHDYILLHTLCLGFILTIECFACEKSHFFFFYKKKDSSLINKQDNYDHVGLRDLNSVFHIKNRLQPLSNYHGSSNHEGSDYYYNCHNSHEDTTSEATTEISTTYGVSSFDYQSQEPQTLPILSSSSIIDDDDEDNNISRRIKTNYDNDSNNKKHLSPPIQFVYFMIILISCVLYYCCFVVVVYFRTPLECIKEILVGIFGLYVPFWIMILTECVSLDKLGILSNTFDHTS